MEEKKRQKLHDPTDDWLYSIPEFYEKLIFFYSIETLELLLAECSNAYVNWAVQFGMPHWKFNRNEFAFGSLLLWCRVSLSLFQSFTLTWFLPRAFFIHIYNLFFNTHCSLLAVLFFLSYFFFITLSVLCFYFPRSVLFSSFFFF